MTTYYCEITFSNFYCYIINVVMQCCTISNSCHHCYGVVCYPTPTTITWFTPSGGSLGCVNHSGNIYLLKGALGTAGEVLQGGGTGSWSKLNSYYYWQHFWFFGCRDSRK
jgi:hypothetical protein